METKAAGISGKPQWTRQCKWRTGKLVICAVVCGEVVAFTENSFSVVEPLLFLLAFADMDKSWLLIWITIPPPSRDLTGRVIITISCKRWNNILPRVPIPTRIKNTYGKDLMEISNLLLKGSLQTVGLPLPETPAADTQTQNLEARALNCWYSYERDSRF